MSQKNMKGIQPITPEEGIESFSALLSASLHNQSVPVQVAVMPFNWSQWHERRAFFAELVPETFTKTTVSFREQLEAAAISTRRTLLQEHVRSTVGQVLGWSERYVALEQGFFDIGMDSLTSLELRNRLQSSLGCKLPSTLTFKYPTVERVVEYLAEKVLTEFFVDASRVEAKEQVVARKSKSKSKSKSQEPLLEDAVQQLAEKLGVQVRSAK